MQDERLKKKKEKRKKKKEKRVGVGSKKKCPAHLEQDTFYIIKSD